MENRAALGALERPTIASPPIPSSPSHAIEESAPPAASQSWHDSPFLAVAFALMAFAL